MKNNLFNKTPMKKIKSYRCVICGNVISTCELYNTLDGRKTCANCYKIIWKIPSTLISFRPTGVESIRFTKIFGLTSNIYSTSTSVFAAPKDIPRLEEWLESVDEPAYEMDDQLC